MGGFAWGRAGNYSPGVLAVVRRFPRGWLAGALLARTRRGRLPCDKRPGNAVPRRRGAIRVQGAYS